jgi:hypothetical protein
MTRVELQKTSFITHMLLIVLILHIGKNSDE